MRGERVLEVKNNKGNDKVLILKVGQEDVDGMLINYDINDSGKYDYLYDDFVNSVVNYLPEYAMGYNPVPLLQTQYVPALRESARSVIKIKRITEIKSYLDNDTPYQDWDPDILRLYNRKGVFSEIILHFILREFKDTLPLISKIYFKDSNAVEAHGFDAVHVSVAENKNTLWLGETKFYDNSNAALIALIEDLNKHFIIDYLNEQFVIIGRALTSDNPLRTKWIGELSQAKTLSEKFGLVKVPLLCIYEDTFAKEIIDALNRQENIDIKCITHISDLKKYFDNKNNFANKHNVEILLILLPVESKDMIVAKILERICNMQNI